MRPYTTVMLDIARVFEEVGTDRTLIPQDRWPDIIRELAELDDEAYAHSLETLSNQRITDISVKLATSSR